MVIYRFSRPEGYLVRNSCARVHYCNRGNPRVVKLVDLRAIHAVREANASLQFRCFAALLRLEVARVRRLKPILTPPRLVSVHTYCGSGTRTGYKYHHQDALCFTFWEPALACIKTSIYSYVWHVFPVV